MHQNDIGNYLGLGVAPVLLAHMRPVRDVMNWVTIPALFSSYKCYGTPSNARFRAAIRPEVGIRLV